ncbi:MAG TPA: protein kinase [Gemmataceae bacterium]|nr:protein kinase [Gemmataceae bacterium]
MLQTRKRKREPIPGYRLIEPLGRGGFGEVWKCEAPGGLFKAIKFVAGEQGPLPGASAAVEELKAIQHIKSLRHPFLLSMERVELIDGELVIVMELADKSLADVFNEYRAKGAAGISRDELLGYLHEAADVLDLMNLRHGLQHLDIKPANLFLVSNHVKVADFGLVRSLSDGAAPTERASPSGGMTALYAAPEMFDNAISSSCDQYSLAVVYQELLTGSRPFNGKNMRQLLMQHSTAEPDLQAVPQGDRAAVARALSKDPEQRFPTCMAFIQALEGNEKVGGDSQPSADTSRGGATTPLASVVLERGPAQARYLPDYQFLRCLGRTPFSEAWETRTPEGKRRLVKVLFGVTWTDAAREQEAIAHLQSLRHPALPELRIISAGPGCLLVDTDLLSVSLRDRFQECRNRKERGIPRRQLLDWLRRAAESLDELANHYDLQHLGLHPRNLLFDGDQMRIADFGLLPLVWQPVGQLQGQLQARYTAPELLEQQIGPACDSYSLAVIFQEMLTGTTPWRGRRSGLPNLEALSASDRAVLARALDIDSGQRFATCTELIAALEGDRSATTGEPGTGSDIRPGASAIVAELIVEARGALPATEAEKWASSSVGILQGRFPARLVPNNARASFETFRRQWNAQLVRETDNSLVLQVALPGRFWQRWLGGAPGLLVEIRWTRPRPGSSTLPEVSVRVRCSDKKIKPDDSLIKELGPLLLDSLRSQLEAYPERRNQERVGWPHPVRATFLLTDGKPGESLEGRGKDISLGGMGLYLPRAPAGSQIELELRTPARGEPIILSGHCVRVQRCGDGWFETGVLF